MTLYQLILIQNECYKSGRTFSPKGIMVHSTGANNPKLSRYVGPDDGRLGKNVYNNHWNQPRPEGRQICVHAFIGKLADGSVATYQTLPWTMRGWHCAKGPKGAGNDFLIGFEICEDNTRDPVYFRQVFDEAVGLCAYLCRKYGLTEKDIIDHAEGYRQGIASNHGDVAHWFPKHGESMNTFRAAVKKALSGKNPAPAPTPAPPKPAPAPKVTTAEQKAFIDRVGKSAQASGASVLPSLAISQAILESGWGKSELAQKANALFGIKAGTAWKGPHYEKKTGEHIDGKQVEITAAFRAYGSWEESIADHAALLRGSRYKAVQGERDHKKACRAVHAAGYATAPDYADKLIRLVEQYGLTAWDAPAPGVITHTVVKGDTLWSLAARYLGNPKRWPEIQKANGGIDPKKLPIGKILKIPGGASK
jgi:flagellum-specific peptidoglycan hydrolase FlgJ